MLIALLLVAGCNSDMEKTELTDWEFEYNDQWYSAKVPGCIHTDLMAHGLIPDPFYGTNEDSVQWVGKRVWKYRTIITRDMWEGFEHCDLVLYGATYCDVWLSGESFGTKYQARVMTGENMFREYRVCLFDVLLDNKELPDLGDEAVLEITFYPIEQNNEDHFATEVCEADGYPWPDMDYELPDHRAMSRMAPYMLGWDWGPKLSTVGILGSARLECYNGELPEEPVKQPKSWNVELRQEKDSIGQSFAFYRNGKPLFVKGANWIPVHSFPVLDSANRARYRHLLTSANENVRLEAEQQVRRIAQHPCVVLWCGNNEVKNGWEDWGWQEQYKWTDAQRAQLQHGIDTLFGEKGILAQAVKQYDPLQRPYITSSPLFGWGHPECVTHGDSHYWGVWWGEQPFEMYKEKTGRFMSEFGFQSYPDYSTVCRFCPEDQRTIDSPTMKSHQKHGRGREIIDKAMKQYYGLDSRSLSLEDYCYVSQLLRSIDCYGNWKALHYRVRDLFSDTADLSRWEKYYKTYPKNLHLPKAKYQMNKAVDRKGRLTVTLKAQTNLRDVMLQTEPHVDGRFENNYFDLPAGNSVTLRFIPADPKADLSQVKVTLKCLNQVLNR